MPNYSGATASADGSERGGGGASDLRGDLLAFSVARQAAMGQEEIFRAVKALRDENERLVDRCKALGREVSLTQAENKQLAGHISRVLGLVTSFTQAQASSNNEVRSVLTAQVLALTEHVSALTKQFTIFQLDQRQNQWDSQHGSRRDGLRRKGSGTGELNPARRAAAGLHVARGMAHIAAARLVHRDGAEGGLVQRPVRLAAAGQIQREAMLEQRRGDHEDDQQHKRQVDERRDVEVAQRNQRVAL